MIQFDPSSESIYYDQDISLIRKWTDVVYIETFHWCACRGCKTMCMNGDFQHVHFLTTWTVINVGQSTMQLTCCGTTRNFRKIRLQSSLLNCDYTLQVLQHVSTTCNQRLHCNDVCVCFYYSNITQYKRLHSRLMV